MYLGSIQLCIGVQEYECISAHRCAAGSPRPFEGVPLSYLLSSKEETTKFKVASGI